MKLTPKQKRFADYYLETGNATEACRRAGYKGDNLNTIAAQNLTKLSIKQYLEKRMSEMDKKRIASAEEVLEFLSRVVRGEEKDQFGFETSIADRTKAGELLLKRYKIFDRIDEKLEELKRKDMELNIKRKELEIEKMSNVSGDNKVLTALDKLEKALNE